MDSNCDTNNTKNFRTVISPMIMSVLQSIYDSTIRPMLPRKLGVWNGVVVRVPKLFDMTDINPHYEGPSVRGIRNHVRSDDTVVVIGGGLGVSTVVACRHGESVTVYEGSAERLEFLHETLKLNQVEDSVTVKHSVVGPEKSLGGERGNPDQVDPADLPECDVLEMDCEGAEIGILQKMTIRPRVIIVECHGKYDTPESAVRAELVQRGYEVVNCTEEYPDNGIYVLTAVRSQEKEDN